MQNIFEKKLLMLKPESLLISQNHARKSFDQAWLKSLAESIAVNGILEPLAVKKTENGKFEILAGVRRFKAAQMANLRRIPCVVHTLDGQNAEIFSLTENIQRHNLELFEEVNAIDRIIKKYDISQTQAAIKLGIEPQVLTNKLKLLNLSPDIRQKITDANLTEHHARALLKLSIPERESTINYIIENALSLSESEQYISGILNPKPIAKMEVTEKPLRKQSIGDIRLFYNSLSKLVITLKNSGINANTRKSETAKYIEYKIRIKKDIPQEIECQQLKIC
ncbi:MAG: ParB/RepB/Spo0J family partition protein [Ruminococcaceae bacterium]|nr:ParB/RepB/Spo0J family partition protein [Oscillospiraceae bacterium]